MTLLLLAVITLLETTQTNLFIDRKVFARSDPPSRGIPDDRKPAGTRGCEETFLPFTPVLFKKKDSEFSGFTLNEHLTFWFYVPYKTDSVVDGEFILEEEKGGNLLWRVKVKLPKTSGFVSISIPKTKSIEENKLYRWHFILRCASDTNTEPGFVYHKGSIQKINQSALKFISNQTEGEKDLNYYINNELWYDAVTNLAEIHQSPSDWNSLLKTLGLEALETEQIQGAVIFTEE